MKPIMSRLNRMILSSHLHQQLQQETIEIEKRDQGHNFAVYHGLTSRHLI